MWDAAVCPRHRYRVNDSRAEGGVRVRGNARREWATRPGEGSATVSKAFRSSAFLRSRAEADRLVRDPVALRRLADRVDAIDVSDSSLELIADRLGAAVAFTRALAESLEREPSDGTLGRACVSAGEAARHRLLLAGLHYLITPVDLIPDFKVGGYVDDAVLLSCVFGMASTDLASFPGGELTL